MSSSNELPDTKVNTQVKKILVTGSKGQLGRSIELLAASNPKLQLTLTDVDDLDLTDREAVEKAITEGGYDYVVNCAAYTAVDRAESDEVAAARINTEAVGNIARAARTAKVKVIHISTDYVFSGKNHRPYDELDEPYPTSVYGRTKLEGEGMLTSFCPDAVIIRTAWLYSEFGNNFVKTILRKGEETGCLRVVADQIGTPTYAGDLAQAVLDVIDSEKWTPGVYHFTDEGVASWYDFAIEIIRTGGLRDVTVEACNTKDYPTAATRPSYSVLDKGKIKRVYGVQVPYWKDSLQLCLDRMARQ